MSNLWNTANGRAALKTGVYHIIRRRIAKFFGRKFVIQFDAWIQSGKTAFSFVDVLGQLNELNDPQILNLYELLGQIGELPETYQDTDFYINNLTGDDVNGLGNASSPWATAGRALEYLRNTVIKHRVRILAAHTGGAVQTTYQETIDWFLDHAIDGGSLAIIGVGAPIETKQATQIAVKTALGKGAQTYNQTDLAWTTNDWIGEWFMGPDQKAYAVHKNDAQDLYFHYVNVATPGVGDPIRGIIPGVRFRLNHLTVKLNDAMVSTPTGGRTSLAFVNCELYMVDSTSPQGILIVNYSNVWFDFVIANFTDGNTHQIYCNEAMINTFPPVDTTLAAASETGIVNIGDDGYDNPGLSVRRKIKTIEDDTMFWIHNSSLFTITNSAEFFVRSGNLVLSRCAGHVVEALRAEMLEMSFSYISSNVADNAIHLWQTDAQIIACYMGLSKAAVYAIQSRLEIWDETEMDAATAFAIDCDAFVNCRVNGAMVGFVGNTADIRFNAPAVSVNASWPADGVSVDDGVSTTPTSIVVRKD